MTANPRKKLVPRYEVLGARDVRSDDEDWERSSSHHYEGQVAGVAVRARTLRYETHLDARLGAQGLRAVGYVILGIRDLHTGDLVDATFPERGRGEA